MGRRVLIAPDKFKSSLSATQAADAIAAGIRTANPAIEVDLCPIADGGEGTVATMLAARGGRLITRRVTGPLPEMKVDASFALLPGNTAVIEMAAASGLALLAPAERNPLNTTTFGTGELITAAVREGATKIILGLGGSATTDAGIGCAQACGFTILMRDGEPTSMSEPLCGRDLSNVLMVKHGRGEITAGVPVLAAVDVNNPLFGSDGAAAVFGPQKGASPAVVRQLDTMLKELAERTNALDSAYYPGAGAAGGFGFGVLSFFRGQLCSGFELIADAVELDRRLSQVELCFTGEGRLDRQSSGGKAAIGIANRCRARQVPCIALVGSHDSDAVFWSQQGITACFSICNGPMSLEAAMGDAERLLREAACNCAGLWTEIRQ